MTISSTKSSITARPSGSSRVELFFKNPSELQDRVRFLRLVGGVSSFNLVNKHKDDSIHVWVDSIRQVFPEANICAHYSLKYNKVPRKGLEDQKERLNRFMDQCQADEVLLLSGSGPKAAWNTIEALKALQEFDNNEDGSSTIPTIAVAYNPYYPAVSDQQEENKRLEGKLATGRVAKIYLQFGTDLDRLKKGLDFCRTTAKNYSKVAKTNVDISLAGSLFSPTAQLIAQQKFRPWNGVFLSREFLSGQEHASAIVVEIMKVYQSNHVEFLWEAPGIRNEKDMTSIEGLLRRAAIEETTEAVIKDNDTEKIASVSGIDEPVAKKTKID